jgi:hypothetical protein
MRRLFLVALVLVLASCASLGTPASPDQSKEPGTNEPVVQPPNLVSITVNASNLTLAQNQTVLLTVTAKDSSSNVVTPTLTWVSSNPQVASVDANGTVRAFAIGEAVITASASNVSSNPVAVTVANLWSDPNTWVNGKKPAAGDEVVIGQIYNSADLTGVAWAEHNVILDESPASLEGLNIYGTLTFAEKDLELQTDWIMLHGSLKIGSETAPFTHKATMTLTADDVSENVMGMGTRGILMMGGRLELYGLSPNVTWTKLNAHAASGSTQLTLKDSVDWQAKDQVVIAPTDFFPHDSRYIPDPNFPATELLELTSASGTTVNLSAGLQKSRWGQLQYVNESGLTLTPTTSVTNLVLDERAAVGNLTRNIVIQAADDTLWQTEGFGAQIMAMEGASLKLDGVELRRMGQLGREKRYPIHWHMLSYSESGADLGDVAGQFVRNSSIHNSKNRCVVIHGTNGVTFSNNICYDITGHAVFLEDAVERRNIIESNLVLRVRPPETGKRFLEHDEQASGFWLTNPDNTVRGNIAGDAWGKGFWLAYPRQTLGLSQSVDLQPRYLPFGVFEDNTAHSNREGIHLDNAPTRADPGLLESHRYEPMKDGKPFPGNFYNFDHWLRFKLEDITVYKNGTNWGNGGFWNRVSWPDYVNWVSADNTGAFFAGAGDNGRIVGSLMVGSSLNVTPAPNTTPLVALASYHSTFDMTNNTIVNFPFVAQAPGSGAFKTDDYYTLAVDKGLVRNPNNRLINSHPGYRVPPPNMRPSNPNDHWTLAGALWDAHGYWGPAENFWVYDVPFLTSGATCVQVAPAGQNGASCDGEYYGVGDYITDFDTRRYMFQAPLEVSRRDPNNLNQEMGQWTVADGNVSTFFPWMRHFAAHTGGSYIIRFPKRTGSGYDLPKRFEATISNAYRSTDWFMLGIHFDSAVTPSDVTLTSNANVKRTMTAALSLAEVSSSSGDKYWQDTAQNILWVKIVGGLPSNAGAENSDVSLYQDMRLVVQ